jgi:integrase/recombinase XerD
MVVLDWRSSAIRNTGARRWMMAKDLVAVDRRVVTPAQFGDLADVPPELEWLANITNPKTRRAYKNDVEEFSAFIGLRRPAELRSITRAHVISLAQAPRVTRPGPVQNLRKLSALSALFEFLCESNAVAGQSGRRRQAANVQQQRSQHAGTR